MNICIGLPRIMELMVMMRSATQRMMGSEPFRSVLASFVRRTGALQFRYSS